MAYVSNPWVPFGVDERWRFVWTKNIENNIHLHVFRWSQSVIDHFEVHSERFTDSGIEIIANRSYPYASALLNTKLLGGFVQSLSRQFGLSSYGIGRVGLILPKIPRYESVSNHCEDADDLKGTFDCQPKYFYLATLGLCLYGYGYISAKCGRGDWRVSLAAFLIGFPVCCYGVFEIVNTVAEAQRVIAP